MKNRILKMKDTTTYMMNAKTSFIPTIILLENYGSMSNSQHNQNRNEDVIFFRRRYPYMETTVIQHTFNT